MSGKLIKRLLSDPDLLHLYLEQTHLDTRQLLNRPLEHTRFVIMDTETTGLHAYSGDQIISIAMLEYQGLQATGKIFEKRINPERTISEASTAIHGITNADVAGCKTLEEILPDIMNFIGDAVIVGHHTQFDIRFLNKTLKRQLGITLRNPWLDTMLLYLTHEKRFGHYTLEDAAASYNITINNRHTALGDAQAAAELFVHLATVLSSVEQPVYALRNKQGKYQSN